MSLIYRDSLQTDQDMVELFAAMGIRNCLPDGSHQLQDHDSMPHQSRIIDIGDGDGSGNRNDNHVNQDGRCRPVELRVP